MRRMTHGGFQKDLQKKPGIPKQTIVKGKEQWGWVVEKTTYESKVQAKKP